MTKPKKRKFRLRKQASVALAVFGVGLAVLASGAYRNSNNNKVRNDLLASSSKISCHVTSVESKEQTVVTDDNVATGVLHTLVGTYDYNGGKYVVTLSDQYSSREMAEKHINTDRDIYISNDRLGVAGARDIQIPDADNSARPYLVLGIAVSLLGMVISFCRFLQSRKKQSLEKKR